ncbi:MAG TPA: SprB repeat-containing protein, partial [Chitinophagales bacterium]|nr:SprB repeat-containing protein [Chitinophagales bacterium]
MKQGRQVSFQLGNYDHTKTVVIDPWTTTPALPNTNSAFYIKTDSAGNAYVYGGDSPFKLVKYSPTGSVVWSYLSPWTTSSHWFGSLAVDRHGNSYITNGDGATLAKIDTAGSLAWSNSSSQAPANAIEYWCMDFNCDQTKLYIGGTRDVPLAFDFHGDVFQMDLSNGAITNYVSVVHPSFSFTSIGFNEVRSLTAAPDGNMYYLTLDTIGSVTQGLNINYGKPSTYSFPYYLPYSNTGGGQGQNNIRATAQYIYSTDGGTLHKRDISTGAVVATVTIPGGSANNNSGLAIDSCGNVFVGSQNKVVEYDASLNFITSASTPAAVYDISIGNNGDVMACGNSFAVALAMNACSQVKSICYTPVTASLSQQNPCAGQCNGSATANAASGTGNYTYLWSNNGTTQTIDGLCAGSYTVTITDIGTSQTASATTSISPVNNININTNPVSTSCGNNNGSVTANVTGGNGTFAYLWSNNGTTQTISNLAPGTYTVTATDLNGCSSSASAV